jgi:plasmid segregation protein ParM
LDALGATAPGDIVEVDGAAYLVGAAALDAGAAISWAEGRDGLRRDHDVLTAIALAAARVPSGPVRLLVGLPLAQFAALSRPLRESLAGRTLRVRARGVWAWAAEYRVVEARAFPQGAAAYAAVVDAMQELRRRPVGVIDTGYRTTDYLIVRHTPDGRARALHHGTAEVGWQDAAALCRAAIAAQGIDVTLSQVERALESGGVVWWRGREVQLPVEDAARAVAVRVADAARHAWRDELDGLAAVILVGGAARLIAPHLPWPHTVVPEEPEFANARGFLILDREKK